MVPGTLTVTCEAVPELSSLRREWLDLEARAQASVFLSWQWVGHWLHLYRPTVHLLRVRQDGRTLGLGLVVEAEERRHGVLRSKCLRLHQTGHPLLDQIWIEYNGFLAERGREQSVAAACLDYLCREMRNWDEFVVGAIDADEAEAYARHTGLFHHVRWSAPCYGVDLNDLRRHGQPYLDTLSRNTRYQIRRSARLYEAQGDIRLVRPDTLAEALAMFDRIGPRHLQRWGEGPDQSGFANPDFVLFHREMIRAQWPEGGVDLVSLTVGEREVAAFYNLLYNQVVYFYLGGIEVENDNRLKPGLLGHSLCIEDYRHHGFHYYDFMGGNERYKQNLGQRHRNLVQLSLQRGRLKLRLEHMARKARQKWLREEGSGYEH